MDPIQSHFIFIDIVDSSNLLLSPEEQVKKIEVLTEKIKNCKSFKDTPKEKRIVLPTGDGVAIGFKDSVYLPFDLAKELHKKLNEYNSGKQWLQKILLHIGIHSADVLRFTDLNEKENVWGEGTIIAQRIMSKAPAGFILLSEEIGKKLAKSEMYKKTIYHAGYIQFKHEKRFVWYAYDDDFGRNDISEIKDLSKTDSEFSAKLDKTHYKLGDIIRVTVDFTGKLTAGFYDVQLRAPKDKTFPNGKKNKWIPAPKTFSQIHDRGKLKGNVAKVFDWNVHIKQDYPTGTYWVYIRVYDHLPDGKRPVIREKVEEINITKI